MAGEEKLKIFPRNLTARAEHVVRGNPPSTRPESGVDNCYPGLEFDQRNMDKAFFPGLLVEFHRPDGARVVAVPAGGVAAAQGLRDSDRPMYLWAMMGRTEIHQPAGDPPVFFFTRLGGMDVWRWVHDLLPGRIALLIGPRPGINAPPSSIALIRSLDAARDSGDGAVTRDAAGRLQTAIVVGDRARYLDDDGVIDPAAYEPGELTRSLCAPWQFDFRDCGCFYWAASKPDVVTSADGRHPYLNFQRRDRTSDPPPADVPPFFDPSAPDPADRDLRHRAELDYPELVEGWNRLPVVLNDRESEVSSSQPPSPISELFGVQRVIEELAYLATVEHALCVQYLFSHYSLRAPMVLPANASATTRRIFAAASEVFSVAVDEMRHLRWANEALALLGHPPSLGRADPVGRPGRPTSRPFALLPLSADQLQWYIDVEAPSQSVGQGLDGMYVRLHVSIDRQPGLFAERERLVTLIKLIIDEGEDHFERFESVQRHLAGLAPDTYLRPLRAPTAGTPEVALADESDRAYAQLLAALRETLSRGDLAGGRQLQRSITLMRSLHATNHRLAGQGIAPRFRLPTPGPP